MLDHAYTWTNDRRWTIATGAYELRPQHVHVGLQGFACCIASENRLQKRGCRTSLCLRANAKTDGSWRVCKKVVISIRARPARYLKRKGRDWRRVRKRPEMRVVRHPSDRSRPRFDKCVVWSREENASFRKDKVKNLPMFSYIRR